MPNNKDRLIKSNYKEFDSELLLVELNKATLASNSLNGSGVENKARDLNGVNILTEELLSRGITPPSTLLG